MSGIARRTLGALLFPDFELLDVCGPLEVFGNRNFTEPLFDLVTVAAEAGAVRSVQGVAAVADHGLADCPRLDVILVPGGMGTRAEVENRTLIDWIARRAREAEIVASVCTGAALLARAGVLDGVRATTNKRAFDWVKGQGPAVDWVWEARWVDAGRILTSSGVSAGIDMALHLAARLAGRAEAEKVAAAMEYVWQSDPGRDPFAPFAMTSTRT